eukprot:11955346-Alexandrium_andersonii.AAC.1
MPSSRTASATPARTMSLRGPEQSGLAEASNCGATCGAQLRSSWPPTGHARSLPSNPRCSGSRS